MTAQEALNLIVDDATVVSRTRTTRLPQSPDFVGVTWIGRQKASINGNDVPVVILNNDNGQLHMAGLEALLDAINPQLIDGNGRTALATRMKGQHLWVRYDVDNTATNPRKVWQVENDQTHAQRVAPQGAPQQTAGAF